MTTNDDNRFPSLACPTFTPVAELRNIERKLSWWKRVKRAVAKRIYSSVAMQVVCCTNNDAYADFKQCEQHERSVRIALMQSRMYGTADSAISVAIAQTLADGYDMRQSAPPPSVETTMPGPSEDAVAGRAMQTMPASESVGTTTGPEAGDNEGRVMYARPPQVTLVPNPPVVRAVPCFTAAVVTALRCKLGQRPGSTPGNKEVVEREALRLMRDYNVREIDRITHLPLIIRAYFNEDVHYRAATHASRMSKFQKWLLGSTKPVTVDPTC
jgi:hypothetical protein